MSKSEQVAKYLRNQISRGIWEPGKKIPSEKEISGELGVSYMTVKNVLAQMANEGIIDRKQKFGSFVSKQRKVSSVAIVADSQALTSSTGFFYRRLVEESQKVISAGGFQPVLSVGHGVTSEEFLDSIHLLKINVAQETIGIIGTRNLGPLEARFRQTGIYTVSIVAAAALDECCVVMDYGKMIQLGTKRLHEAGYPDFVIVHSDTPEDKLTQEIYRTMERFRSDAVGGDARRILSIPWSPNFIENVYTHFKAYLLEHRPRAVFFTDDVVCDSATRVFLELGIQVPRDMAILSQSIRGRVFHLPVKITTVEFDPAQAVAEAWKLLERQITRQPLDTSVVWVAPELHEGESL